MTTGTIQHKKMQPQKARDRRGKQRNPLTFGVRRCRLKMDPSMEQHEPTTWEQIGDHKSQSYPSRHTGVEEKEIQNLDWNPE
jgi:hypothetical protein